MKRFVIAILVIGLAARSTPVTAQESDSGKKAEGGKVPFEILRTKHLAVQIKVNGKGPFRVIFDTGAPVTLLNNRIAKEAELLGKSKPQGPAFFGMRGQMKIKDLQVGDVKTEDSPVIIMDHPALSAVSKVLGPVDGIVGFPFFSKFKMTLDYQAMTMTLVPVDYQGSTDATADLMLMMMNTRDKPAKKVLASCVVWGFCVDKSKDDTDAGVDVCAVLTDSAAATAGLKSGDRLLVLDGHWTDSIEDCHRAAAGVKPGQAVKVKVKRGEQTVEVTVTPKAGL